MHLLGCHLTVSEIFTNVVKNIFKQSNACMETKSAIFANVQPPHIRTHNEGMLDTCDHSINHGMNSAVPRGVVHLAAAWGTKEARQGGNSRAHLVHTASEGMAAIQSRAWIQIFVNWKSREFSWAPRFVDSWDSWIRGLVRFVDLRDSWIRGFVDSWIRGF